MLSPKEWETLDKVKETLSLEIEIENKESFQHYLKENILEIIIINPQRMGAINLPPEKIIKFSIYMLNFSATTLATIIKRYLDTNKKVKIRLGKNRKFIKYGMTLIQITSFLNGAIESIS